MDARIETVLLSQGEERFSRGMEELSTAERREIFQALGVPRGGAAASARQRMAKRIRLAWERLEKHPDEDVAATFARYWLARTQMDMIRKLLDRLDVEHQDGFLRDEKALTKVPADALAAGLQQMLQENESADVHLYTALMDLPVPEEVK